MHEAIQVARRAGLKLVIAGIVQDQEYFETQVEPYIDGDQVEYLGSVGPAQRPDVLGQALALLHLISFDEPFETEHGGSYGVRHARHCLWSWLNSGSHQGRRNGLYR